MSSRLATSALWLLVCAASPTLGAQSAVTSKVVGSDNAAENRRLANLLGRNGPSRTLGDTLVALAGSSATRIRDSVAGSVTALRATQSPARAFLAFTNAPSPASGSGTPARLGGAQADTARFILETLRALRAADPIVARHDFAAISSGPALLAEVRKALVEYTKAQTSGQTNDQRWFLGGQPGIKLTGDGGVGETVLASTRATYFVPLAASRGWQLPVVGNLSDLAVADKKTRDDKLQSLVGSAEGALLAVEPTWPAWHNDGGDFRVRFSVSGGVKLNSYRDSSKSDTTARVTLSQLRLAPTLDFEIGMRESGQPPLLLELRPVQSWFGSAAYRKAFGSSGGPRDQIQALETYLVVPIGAGTAFLAEATIPRHLPRVFRLGLFTQAAAKTPEKPITSATTP